MRMLLQGIVQMLSLSVNMFAIKKLNAYFLVTIDKISFIRPETFYIKNSMIPPNQGEKNNYWYIKPKQHEKKFYFH